MTRITFGRVLLPVLSLIALIAGVDAQSQATPPSSLIVASVTGSTVSLQWLPGSAVQSYVVEAGSSPGASDIGRFNSGSPAPAIVATNVPAGTYYVRVRGVTSAGETAASNEITFTVGSICSALPGSPGSLSSSVSGSSVQLLWSGSPTGGVTYMFEIGSSAGASNLGTAELGTAATSYLAEGVAAGTYFVRVRARNACGLSAPSNDTMVVVSGGTTSGPAQLRVINSQASTILSGSSAGQLVVAGEVVNTGGTAASLVWINIEVFSPSGSRLRGLASEIVGRSRRNVATGQIENWTLGPGETGCFAMSLGQASTIGRYDIQLNLETFPTEPLRGQLQAAVSWRTDSFESTRLRVATSQTNRGSTPTAWNRVAFVMKDGGGRAIGCGSMSVYGRTNVPVPGLGTTNVILPGETGFPLNGADFVTSGLNIGSLATITAWPQWKE